MAELEWPLLRPVDDLGRAAESDADTVTTASFASTQPRRAFCAVSTDQRREVEETMQKHSERIRRLDERMKELGLQQEYQAFKDRYLEWRQGKATGARGEMIDERKACDTFGEKGLLNEKNMAANRGFGFWYPTVQEWLWKRTMSYWIAVTFFEGSIFFCISSFLYNWEDYLGPNTFRATTLGGYIGGKINFFVCCYLMCLETVNFSAGQDPEGSENDNQLFASPVRRAQAPEVDETFYWNPFRYWTACRRLKRANVSPLPYVTAILYFVGVLWFSLGLSTEFLPAGVVAPIVSALTLRYSFILGSVCFTAGGCVECYQNVQNLTSETWLSALGFVVGIVNTMGGSLFLAGSITQDTYRGNCLFGIGSFLFMVASSLQIWMWKDEQFGLSFLAVLNDYHNLTRGRQSSDPSPDRSRFSGRGALFVLTFCWCGAMSTYNFEIEVVTHFNFSEIRPWQMAFNELLPCIFCHMMLLLTSAVVRPPVGAPFKQLYMILRCLCVASTVNSTLTFREFVMEEIQQ